MLYVVRFVDKPGRQDLRQTFLPAHIDWLDRNKDVVLIGGSLRENPGDVPLGGLWLLDAPGKAEVEALLKTDPFWIHGLRQSHEVLHWFKAFPDRKVLV